MEKVFKSPYQVGKAPTYVPQEPTFFNRVLLGLATIMKRKDNAPEQDVIVANRFSFESEAPTLDNRTAYTCPRGFRAYLNVLVANVFHSGASGEDMCEIDVGGVTYAEIKTYALNEIQNLVITPAQGTLINEGESINIYTDSLATLRVSGQGYLFPIN